MSCVNSWRKGALVATAIGLSVFAQASDVTLQGTATGTFNNGLTVINGLTYVGSTFDITSSDGFYALGSNAGSPNFNNLGSFSLTGTPADYLGDVFTLTITFSEPTGIEGSDSGSFTASMIGDVSSNAVGGVTILFPSTSETFDFQNGDTNGFFTIVVNDLSITPGLTAPATGEGLANQTTPAPAAAGSLITGLVGTLVRKKRSR